MHNGVFATLDQVIAHYNVIPGDNANLDPRLRRPGGVQNLGLTAQQQNDLVAFLRTLTGTAVYTDDKWSDPFDAQNQLTLIVLPPDAVTITDHGDGTATIACQAAPNLVYNMESSPDLKEWTHVETLASDASGRCEKHVGISGTQFYRFTTSRPCDAASADRGWNFQFQSVAGIFVP